LVLSKVILKILRRVEEILLVLLLGALVLFSFTQLVLRLVFSFGFPWADIFLRHIVLWIGFIGGVIALDEGKHFAIDFFKRNFSGKTLDLVNVISDFFALITLYFLFNFAMGFWVDEYLYKSILFTVGSIEVPAYSLNCIIPIGFLLLLTHFAFKTLEDLFLFFSKSK